MLTGVPNATSPAHHVAVTFVGCSQSDLEPPVLSQMSLLRNLEFPKAATTCAVECYARAPAGSYRALAGVRLFATYVECKCYQDTRGASSSGISTSEGLGGCRAFTLLDITSFCPQSRGNCSSAAVGCVQNVLNDNSAGNESSAAVSCCVPFSTDDPGSADEMPLAIGLLLGSIAALVLEISLLVWCKTRSKLCRRRGLEHCKSLRDESEAQALAEALSMTLLNPHPSSFVLDTDRGEAVPSGRRQCSSSSSALLPYWRGNTSDDSLLHEAGREDDSGHSDDPLLRPRAGDPAAIGRLPQANAEEPPATCPVCLETAAAGAGGGNASSLRLPCCDAVLHRICVQQLLAMKLREYSTQHTCPVCFAELFPL
jgi:hypothetical protein